MEHLSDPLEQLTRSVREVIHVVVGVVPFCTKNWLVLKNVLVSEEKRLSRSCVDSEFLYHMLLRDWHLYIYIYIKEEIKLKTDLIENEKKYFFKHHRLVGSEDISISNRGQTRKTLKSNKYFKVKVVIFTILSLIYYPYTVNLPNVLKVY